MAIHRFTAAVAGVLLLAATLGLAATATGGPSPELAPTEVVRLQLDALRHDDAPAAYRYASPGNRQVIGGATEFARMLERQYVDMLTHTGARITLQKRANGEAQVLAELQQTSGQQTAYVFFLSRQRGGDCASCWMTDGVLPLKPKNDQPMYSI